MIVDRPTARNILNAVISAHFGAKEISILEAGGGSWSRISRARNIKIAHITTVDIDNKQLERNNYADNKINADLQDFKSEIKYDLIEAVYVLEHIENVGLALDNLADACKEDGLIVVMCPYMYSLSGMVTRFTPHWFHVFFRRYISGEKDAGKEGFPPFRTFYNPLIAPKRLDKLLNDKGFSTELLIYFESKIYKRIGVMRVPIIAVSAIMNMLTPKSFNARNSEYCMVFRKIARG
jgi:SAM-dependent methyltransferase